RTPIFSKSLTWLENRAILDLVQQISDTRRQIPALTRARQNLWVLGACNVRDDGTTLNLNKP
ncbi:MAG: hypothetical protein AAGC95_17100, partial [Pseudomonadota bacterium]